MVRKILVALLLASALAAAPAASARNPHDQTQPSPSVTTLVDPPTPIAPWAIPDIGLTAGSISSGTTSAADCGACINTCWAATTRSGPSDWSGYVFIFQHLYFCGNGAQITYASVWQSYDQSGWYHLDSAYGPWWSGGCVGCGSIRASGYILWSWASALIGFNGGGSSPLNSTMYAYGSVVY